MLETISKFIADHPAYVELAVFLLGLAESIILLSFFVPATAIFVGVGALLGATGSMLWPIVFAAALGAFVGDVASYVFGDRYRDQVRTTWPLNEKPEWLARARAFVRQWGAVSILLGKFVGPLRPVVPIVCGVTRMKFPLFLVASASSSFIWATAFLAPAYYGLVVFKG